MLDIIVDDREQAVIPYFNKFNFPPNITYNVSRVTTGDYSILYKNHVLFVIERKTWKDLAASIKDGRKHNVEKLLELRQSTGCHIIYLIEGNPLPNPTTNFCRVPYKNLRSHLDHLAFRDNIHMVYSKDEENTVSRIVEIINNYLTIKPSPLLKIDSELNPTDGSGVEKLKENKPISTESVIYKIWQCIPNITSKSSCLFVNKGWHISDLILGRITKNDIYTLKYPNGYIIGNRSDKIWNSTRLTDSVNPIFIKMLSQINGLTKQTAKTILEKSSFEKILLGEIPVKQISDIEKCTKRKLGPKMASEIIKYFVKLVK